MTSDTDWNPNILENTISTTNKWIPSWHIPPGNNSCFDQEGNHQQRTVATHKSGDHTVYFFATTLFDDKTLYFFDANSFENHDIDQVILSCMEHSRTQSKVESVISSKSTPDFNSLRPYLDWLSSNIVQLTFKHNTQFVRAPISTILKKHYKWPFPTLNVHRKDEPVATDTVYLDTPAIDNGAKLSSL